MKSFKNWIKSRPKKTLNVSGWKGIIRKRASGLEMIAINPKTGKEEFMMSGNVMDRKKMEDLAKRTGLVL